MLEAPSSPEVLPVAERSERRIERVRAFLQTTEGEPAEVEKAIEALTVDDLQAFQVNAFYLNLVSAFGGCFSPAELWKMAADAVRARLWRGWEFTAYLAHFDSDDAAPRLRGWPHELIADLLARGRGLVVCSFHVGDYRYLPTDLILHGHFLTLPLNKEACEQTATALAAAPSKRIAAGHRRANVEERRGLLQIARALRRGGVLFGYADGNSGLGGPVAAQGRVDAELFGLPVRVKGGLARLAATCRAPILPLVAMPGRDGGAELVWDPPIEPSGGDQGSEVAATRRMYAFLERCVADAPAQWESSCFLHRWRVPAERGDLPTGSVEQALSEVDELLADGRSLRLDTRRFAVLPVSGAWLCTDTKTLNSYCDPLDRGGTLSALVGERGLGADRLESIPAESRGQVLRFVASLWRQGGIAVCG